MMSFQSSDRNMRDELLEQAKFIYPDEHTQKLLKYLLYNLDDNGYLRVLDSDPNVYLAFDEDDIEKGIHLLQQVGPVGIGARDLKECLLLQITYTYPEQQISCLFSRTSFELDCRPINGTKSPYK